MSQINNITDDNDGWTTVRSKRLIKKVNSDSRPETPALIIIQSSNSGSSPNTTNVRSLSPQPMINESFNIDSETVKKPKSIEPENKNNITGSNNASSNITASIGIPVGIPVNTENLSSQVHTNIQNIISNFGQGFNSGRPDMDQWNMAFEIFKMQEHIQSKMIKTALETISIELKYPTYLRGKTEEQRHYEINSRIHSCNFNYYNIIKNNMKIDITCEQLTSKVIENLNLDDKIKLSYNQEELKTIVEKICKENSKQIESETPVVDKKIDNDDNDDDDKDDDDDDDKDDDDDDDETNSIEENTNVDNKSDSTNKFSYEERNKHKRALVEAQEIFMKICTPTDKQITEFKTNISQVKNWQGVIHKIDISNDNLEVDGYTFSKKHYLNNIFFQKRLKTRYYTLFNPKSIGLIFPKNDNKFLTIVGSFE